MATYYVHVKEENIFGRTVFQCKSLQEKKHVLRRYGKDRAWETTKEEYEAHYKNVASYYENGAS